MFHAQSTDLRSRAALAIGAFDDRWPEARRRAGAMALALALEGALLLVLLALGRNAEVPGELKETLAAFTIEPDPAPEPAPEAHSEDAAADADAPQARPVAQRSAPTEPTALPVPRPDPPTPIPLPRSTPAPAAAAQPGIRAVVRDSGAGPIGPAGSGARPGDSQRVAGSGPNGEPLYAARWYREPDRSELAGYLSTASSPGWALINCRTAPEFRVEDCLLVSEYPEHAGLGRAVLAAAWQFQVRPPRVGGQSMVGAWVRIRISYEISRSQRPATEG